MVRTGAWIDCTGKYTAPKNSSKTRMTWSQELEFLFQQTIESLPPEMCTPANILKAMKIQYLTREQVSSHLQKYRKRKSHITTHPCPKLSVNFLIS